MSAIALSSAARDTREQERLTARPDGRPVMYHHWRDLLFLHFPIEPESVRHLVPGSLEIDTFPDKTGREVAWVGVVAFRMFGIRPRGLPPLPWLSAFPETNVRTYVHRNGREPGVWFLSMDARPKIACRMARAWYREPYTFADMYCGRDGDRVTYRHCRREGIPAESQIVCQVGPRMAPAQPGTLEYFLTERYQLYTDDSHRLWKARVWHEPYPLREASVVRCEGNLTEALGIPARDWEHICFSDGVDTNIYKLTPVPA